MMSCPDPACASAAIVMVSLSPCEVMKSRLTSTWFLSPHSWASFFQASLPPGTQWSHNPTSSVPAENALWMNGFPKFAAANAVDPSAAERSRLRLVSGFLPIETPPNQPHQAGLTRLPAGSLRSRTLIAQDKTAMQNLEVSYAFIT